MPFVKFVFFFNFFFTIEPEYYATFLVPSIGRIYKITNRHEPNALGFSLKQVKLLKFGC